MTIHFGMPEKDYFAHPALSSTGARQLLNAPAIFKHYQTHRRADKDEFDLGSAIHSKVLGTGYAIDVIPDDLLGANGATSTKAAKEFIEGVRARGGIPIKSGVARQVDRIAESVLGNATARRLLEQVGEPEASVFATDPTTGVELKARFDYLAPEPVDLKSGRSAAADAFARSVAAYGYDVQEGHYLDTYYLATGERRDMTFVVVETTAPYLVGVHMLDNEWADMGLVKARRAREIYAECMATDTWPGYPEGVQQLTAPAWYAYEFQDEYEPEMSL